MAPSHFLPCVKPWFHQSRFVRFRREVLPEVSLVASQAEKDLVSAKEGAPAITLPDRVLASWEKQLLFSLKNLSLADSLLSGVGKVVVSSPDEGIPGPSASAGQGDDRQEDLFLLLSSLGCCVSSLASGLASSYTNVVLARRDGWLSRSNIPPSVRDSFRVLPL